MKWLFHVRLCRGEILYTTPKARKQEERTLRTSLCRNTYPSSGALVILRRQFLLLEQNALA